MSSDNRTRRERRSAWSWKRAALWKLVLQSLARSAFSADTLALQKIYMEVTLDNPYRDV